MLFRSHLKAGKVRVVAVTAPQRSPLLPDVATARESGLDYDASIWYAFFTSPGSPAAAVKTLSAELADIMRNSAVSQKVREQGLIPVGSSPEELTKILLQEMTISRELARRHSL